MLDLDPKELGHVRERQIMALARYGRQPIDTWDSHTVVELQRWYRALADVMKDENAMANTIENR